MKRERLDIEGATSLVAEILSKNGLSKSDARLCAEHLVAAEARGYPGHGLRRIPAIALLAGQLSQSASNKVKTEAPGFVVFDAQGRLGIPAVSEAALSAAARLANSSAIVFGVVGYAGTTGSLAIIGEALAARGVVSILMCSSQAAVAPHGSTRAVLGTNPIAITVPGRPTTFCADLATSAWSYGAIRVAADAGRPLPSALYRRGRARRRRIPRTRTTAACCRSRGTRGTRLG